MDQRDIEQGPALQRFVDNRGKRFFGHRRVMFQRHRVDGAAAIRVAREADEAGDGADIGAAIADRGGFDADVEGFGLNGDFHCLTPRDRRKDGDFGMVGNVHVGLNDLLIHRHAKTFCRA